MLKIKVKFNDISVYFASLKISKSEIIRYEMAAVGQSSLKTNYIDKIFLNVSNVYFMILNTF